jgi:D-xylose transport system substrate-binding protein
MTWVALVLLASPRADSAGIKVGLSLPTQREERWLRDRATMEAEAKRLGVDLRVLVTDNDAEKQRVQCERLVAEGVRVLILAPHDASAAALIVAQARASGVEVISYDRLVVDSPHRYLYLAFDSFKVGQLQGEYLASTVKTGNYVVLTGPPSDHNARLYHEGAMSALEPLRRAGNIEVILEQAVRDWQPAEAQRLTAQAIAGLDGGASDAIDAVLAPNDGTAAGVIAALGAHHLAGKAVVTGQDAELAAAIRIVRGTQAMTVFKDTRLLGRKALALARRLALGLPIDTRGRTVSNHRREIPAVLLTPFVVTRENLDAMLIESGYLDRAQVYR